MRSSANTAALRVLTAKVSMGLALLSIAGCLRAGFPMPATRAYALYFASDALHITDDPLDTYAQSQASALVVCPLRYESTCIGSELLLRQGPLRLANGVAAELDGADSIVSVPNWMGESVPDELTLEAWVV